MILNDLIDGIMEITKEEFNEIIKPMWLNDDDYREEIIEELNRCFDKYLESKSNIGVLNDVSNMLQWCYNYIQKDEDSDEKKAIIKELKKLCC